MKWQEARTCVKAYCKNHDIRLNHSYIVDFENGMLTSYEPGVDLFPIKLLWSKLFESILYKEKLDLNMKKDCFLVWNDMSICMN